MLTPDLSQIHVDLTAIEHNMSVIRDLVGPECAICPVLKADGYGLGAAQAARHLEVAGSAMLAVYSPAQAAALARAAVRGPILVLMPVRRLERGDEAYRMLISGRLHLTAHDREHVEDLNALAEHFGTVIPVHLEVDTGMSRAGCPLRDAVDLVKRMSSSRWFRIAGICTQIANAQHQTAINDEQLVAFETIVEACRPHLDDECLVHAGNTYAVLRHRKFHKSMVRVGMAWIGCGPDWMTGGKLRRQAEALKPIVSWRSRIVSVRRVAQGTKVGYGSTWTAPKETRLGVIPVGYADGYPMGLGSTDRAPRPPCVGVALAEGSMSFVPVVGQVNMDQLTIDLSGLDEDAVGVGAPVELIGAERGAPNHLTTLAKAAGTIPHQILCGLNPRIRRVYHAKRAEPAAGGALQRPAIIPPCTPSSSAAGPLGVFRPSG